MNIKKAVTTFKQLPWGTKLELFFYPIFLIWRMPIAWTKSLWEARILLNGQWHRYMGFHPKNAINSLFYRTQWINLDRYGRKGVSPILGLGQYPLKNWFHLSLLSSYIYANAGAVTTLLGTLFWVFSHLIWIDSVGPLHVLVITMILFFSTTAYAMAFARQNYQILGWMWLPMALYGVSSEQWALASFAWFAAGMAGITPVFFAVPIMIMMSLMSESWLPILVLIPALILTASRLLPLILEGGLSSALTNIAKMIGMTQRKVRYNREMNRLGIFTLYFFGLYLFSSLIFWWMSDSPPILLLLGALLFLINQRFLRVADEQSLIVLVSSLFVFTSMQFDAQWLTLVTLWIALSPMGFFLSIQQLKEESGVTKVLINAPFDFTKLQAGLNAFLAPVPEGQRIYFAFNDPDNRYSNIFDGYRVIHEAALCLAADKEVHIFPDWYAVAETNFEGAAQCWGRSVREVVSNCERWDANYAIIYQEAGSNIDPLWLDGFQCLSEFDWADYLHFLRGACLWPKDKPTPKFFLLRRSGLRSPA
jgi:hypothetical protein